MQVQREVTQIQAAIIIVSTIIGVGVLAIPRLASLSADTGAPFITFAGGVIGFISLFILTKLGLRFPEESIFTYGEKIIGKWVSLLLSSCVILFFALLTALTSREFGEVVITSVLQETPLEVTVIIMLALAMLSSRNNFTIFTYIHHLYFPLILFPAILIIILSLKNANALYLLPILGNEPGGSLPGILMVAALFQGCFIFTFVIPAMRRPDKAFRSTIWGFSLACGLYVLIVIATIGVFGSEETKRLLWPTLELAKMTSLPGEVLERLDAAFLAVWVTAVFTTLHTSYSLTVYAISQLARLQDHRMLSYFLLPFIFIVAMLPRNILEMYEIIKVFGKIGLVLTMGYPFVLLMLALIRKKKEDPNNVLSALNKNR